MLTRSVFQPDPGTVPAWGVIANAGYRTPRTVGAFRACTGFLGDLPGLRESNCSSPGQVGEARWPIVNWLTASGVGIWFGGAYSAEVNSTPRSCNICSSWRSASGAGAA